MQLSLLCKSGLYLTLNSDPGAAGKNRRRGKNENEEKRELIFKVGALHE